MQLDRRLGTLRVVSRLGGSLTGPTDRAPRRVALGFVRGHAESFGLTPTDLETLSFSRDYVDAVGTHHLTWTQVVRGLTIFHAGLEAAVTADGRLLTITGPVAHGARGSVASFRLSAARALAAARRLGGVAPESHHPLDRAERVLFPDEYGTRPAWKTRTFVSPSRVDVSVIDAATGRLLWRTNMVWAADQTGTGLAWPLYPSQTIPNGGGDHTPVTFPVADADALSGNNAHVFTDVRGRFEFSPKPRDEIGAADASLLDWTFPAVLDDSTAGQNCTPDWNCTWQPRTPYSWRANRRASATNTYWLLNRFHDHLEAAPIGFTEAAGNFQLVNDDGAGGKDGDPVLGVSLLGAAQKDGLPGAFINNAFIGVGPDGESPFIGLLLFHKKTYRGFPFGPTFPAGDAGVDASIVYHEYTHGLSNRLVTFPDGDPGLTAYQPGAMGEAWSDWYALDLLEREGYVLDTPAVDVPMSRYITGGTGIRFQFADCRVDSTAVDCPAPEGSAAGPGGFTYADFGRIRKGFDPHTDGEIWLQTLWELRDEIGSNAAEMLVTRAMELSPPEPSFLDMRNAILLADLAAFGGSHTTDVWAVFAGRGMGFFAETSGGNDTRPTADFTPPPSCPGDVACGRLEGTITDAASGEPLEGAVVRIRGPLTGIPVDLSATTGADGTYTIADVPFHRYPNVLVSAQGYRPRLAHARVEGVGVLDMALRRDWASLEGGAVIVSSHGRVYQGCATANAFDLNRTTSWQSSAPGDEHPWVVVRLPEAVDVITFGVAPRGCLGRRYSVRDFRILTRRPGHPWKVAVVNHEKHPLREVTSFKPRRGSDGVRLVKLVMGANVRGGGFVGLAELLVRGTPAA